MFRETSGKPLNSPAYHSKMRSMMRKRRIIYLIHPGTSLTLFGFSRVGWPAFGLGLFVDMIFVPFRYASLRRLPG
jgi:hypothetical protein